MDIAIYTLGCKVNQVETQAMERELAGRGHTLVPFDGPADAYIVNTCTVTAVSDKKCRNVIRRARKSAPDGVVAVCGCYAQTDQPAVAALGVDLVSGSAGRMAFLDELEKLLQARGGQVIAVDDALARRDFERIPAGSGAGRTRAMLKVEDGCVNFCSYCIIPYARGPVRSLPLGEAAEQVRRLAEEGCREVVLTGIEISSWGRDLKTGETLIDLIEGVCGAAPDLRVRLGSLEPRTITEEFCRRAAALPSLCPHFHLSLQSGCDATLARMNRKYDTVRYFESVRLLREYFQDPGITTDLITGFPGRPGRNLPRPWPLWSGAPLPPCTYSPIPAAPAPRRRTCPARCPRTSRRPGPGPPSPWGRSWRGAGWSARSAGPSPSFSRRRRTGSGRATRQTMPWCARKGRTFTTGCWTCVSPAGRGTPWRGSRRGPAPFDTMRKKRRDLTCPCF